MRDELRPATDLTLTPRDFLWAVGSLCNLGRRLFDATLIQREFPPPHSAASVVEALRSLELAARLAPLDRRQLIKTTLPRLVFMSPIQDRAPAPAAPGHADDSPAPACTPALLAKVEEGRVLVFPAGTNEPGVFTLEEFDARYTGYSLDVENATKGSQDADAVGSDKAFGFSWFIRELARHRSVWRDVLLASLVIQLIALATPLCSQVIIDKVIVHQTTSTLVVIASRSSIFVRVRCAH